MLSSPSNNYQSSLQEPRRVHSPLPRTTLSTDHCTMELQVFVQFIQFFLAYLYLSEYLKCPFPQGTRNPSLTSQVWFTSQFRSVICIWLGFGSVLQIDSYMIRLWISSANWLWRKQRQDGRLNPPTSLLSAFPAERLRSKCFRRTQRLGREEQLICRSLTKFLEYTYQHFLHIFESI